MGIFESSIRHFSAALLLKGVSGGLKWYNHYIQSYQVLLIANCKPILLLRMSQMQIPLKHENTNIALLI